MVDSECISRCGRQISNENMVRVMDINGEKLFWEEFLKKTFLKVSLHPFFTAMVEWGHNPFFVPYTGFMLKLCPHMIVYWSHMEN